MKMEVVSASKTEQTLVESSANITVITSNDIELSGVNNITDVLRIVPGLDVMTGYATGTDVGGRGLNYLLNSKTLILVNGQRVNNDFTGSAKWLQIPVMLSNIDRIEVLTSPLSALYGANSFSALVNIITKPASKLNGASFIARAGENQSQEYQVGYGNTIKKFDFRVDFNFGKSEGWGNRDSSKIKEKVLPYVPPGRTDTLSGKIKDWYKLSNATFDFGFGINSQSKLMLSGGIDFGEVAVPDLSSTLAKISNNHFETYNYRTLLGYQNKFSEKSDLNVSLSTTKWKDYGGFYKSNFVRHNFESNLSHSFSSKNNMILGLAYEYLTVHAPSMDRERSDNLLGFFVQDEYRLSNVIKLTGGLRMDKHSNLDVQFSPRITVNITPIKNHYFRIGYGQAFRKPTFLENYMYQTNGTTSIVLGMINDNGTSKPENIKSLNFDYQNIIGIVSTRISLFKNFVSDLIDTKKVQPYKTYNYGIIYENSGDIDITGGEIELRAKPMPYLQLFANSSYQYIDYKTPINGQKLSVPKIKGNLGVQINSKSGFFADAVARYTGKREAQYAYVNSVAGSPTQYNFMQVPAVTVFNLNLGYRFKYSWGVITPSIICFNLFNTRNIQYTIFDSSKGYFGLDTPAKNYTQEMKTEFENRNALNDRKLLFSLKVVVF